jgi:ribosome-associated heat shock protein Hsp15
VIRAGDRVRLTVGEWRREVVVKALTEQRGPAAQARGLYDDLSPPPPPRALRPPKAVVRAPGLGRPTKRERRLHDRLRGF